MEANTSAPAEGGTSAQDNSWIALTLGAIGIYLLFRNKKKKTSKYFVFDSSTPSLSRINLVKKWVTRSSDTEIILARRIRNKRINRDLVVVNKPISEETISLYIFCIIYFTLYLNKLSLIAFSTSICFTLETRLVWRILSISDIFKSKPTKEGSTMARSAPRQ